MGLGMSAGPLHDPPVTVDSTGKLSYDSSAEPEATGYKGVQPDTTGPLNVPTVVSVVGDHDDLLSGAPKTGDQPE